MRDRGAFAYFACRTRPRGPVFGSLGHMAALSPTRASACARPEFGKIKVRIEFIGDLKDLQSSLSNLKELSKRDQKR